MVCAEDTRVLHGLGVRTRWRTLMHVCARARTHTHTCTCIIFAIIGYVVPIQEVRQQKATRLVAPLAARIADSSPQLHGPLSAVGVLLYGLARPTDEWGGVWPWVIASEYLSWALGHKIPHLHSVISRWLAFVAFVAQSVLNTAGEVHLYLREILHKLLYSHQWFM